MNNNIDFSDFNKIEIENKSKCRKFTKNKFALVLILNIIILIIIIIFIIHKENQLNKKKSKLSQTKNTLNKINLNISNLKQKIKEAEFNLSNIINNVSKNNTEIEKIKLEYTNLESTNDKLLYNKNDLLAQRDYISNKLNNKIKSLKEDELKDEIEEKKLLIQKIKQRFNDLSISNTNILIKTDYFEKFTESEILTKCYDSVVYGFHVNIFHENCDGYPLLILIKTKNGKNIGAFTSQPNDGIKNITDELSALINIDKNKYFLTKLDKKKNCYVYCNIDEFPRFGNDLIIYRDGHGESNFPDCYDITLETEKREFIEDKKFDIDIMEIYRLKLK